MGKDEKETGMASIKLSMEKVTNVIRKGIKKGMIRVEK